MSATFLALFVFGGCDLLGYWLLRASRGLGQ